MNPLKKTALISAVAVATACAWGQPAAAGTADAQVAALVERAQIENMLADYYRLFTRRSQGDFGAYYTPDGLLDANGITGRGRDRINAVYRGIREGGNTQILISNPRIVVDGSKAVVDLVWTEVISENLLAVPHIVEQGHEHDELVKQDGRWLFATRLVTNDGGLPAALQKTYKER